MECCGGQRAGGVQNQDEGFGSRKRKEGRERDKQEEEKQRLEDIKEREIRDLKSGKRKGHPSWE